MQGDDWGSWRAGRPVDRKRGWPPVQLPRCPGDSLVTVNSWGQQAGQGGMGWGQLWLGGAAAAVCTSGHTYT